MASAGYGNHDSATPKTGERPSPDAAKPREEAAPETKDRRDQSTPGAGTLPDGPQGGDVDPGAG